MCSGPFAADLQSYAFSNSSWIDFPQIFIAKIYGLTMLASIMAPRMVHRRREELESKGTRRPRSIPWLWTSLRRRTCPERDCAPRSMRHGDAAHALTDDTEANNPYFLHSIPMRDRMSSTGSEGNTKDSEGDDLAPTLNSEGHSGQYGLYAENEVFTRTNIETISAPANK